MNPIKTYVRGFKAGVEFGVILVAMAGSLVGVLLGVMWPFITLVAVGTEPPFGLEPLVWVLAMTAVQAAWFLFVVAPVGHALEESGWMDRWRGWLND